jgi:MOSC domain-containing protein YiiM
VLIDGLDFAPLRPGNRLRLGAEVVIELTDVREPCGTLKSVDRRFPNLMLGRSGFVCSVVQEGLLRSGDPVEVLAG